MVIVITGSVHAGKTTVARLLAKTIPKTVCIESDDLRHMAACLSLTESIPYTLRDAATLTSAWLARGFNVVLAYPLSKENHRLFCESVEAAEVITFTLAPRLEVALSQRGERVLTVQEKARIAEQYSGADQTATGISLELGTVLNTSEQSAEETLALILCHVQFWGKENCLKRT